MALAAVPHPRAVFKVLKQRHRNYLSSGTAAAITITSVPNTVATAPCVVSGTVATQPGVLKPASVTVKLMRAAVERASQSAAVTQATGAWTTSIVAASAPVATGYTAVVSSTNPTATATSNSFNRT